MHGTVVFDQMSMSLVLNYARGDLLGSSLVCDSGHWCIYVLLFGCLDVVCVVVIVCGVWAGAEVWQLEDRWKLARTTVLATTLARTTVKVLSACSASSASWARRTRYRDK